MIYTLNTTQSDIKKNYMINKGYSSFINTLVNALKTYSRLYSYKPDLKTVLTIYESYCNLQKALLKNDSPPIIEVPTHTETKNIYSCSLKTCLIESFEEATCYVSAYSYPFYEKIEVVYKNLPS